MRTKTLLSTAIGLTVLLASLVPATAHEELAEEFEDILEELAELIEELEDLDEEFNEHVEEAQEFVEEFDEVFEEIEAEVQESVTAFTGIETFVSEIDPGDVRIADGILHIRGSVGLLTFEGTTLDGTPLTWTNLVVDSLNLNLETGDGQDFGSFSVDLTFGDLRGTFEGHFVFVITGGFGTALRYVGQGSGDFDGMIFTGMAAEDPITFNLVHQGVILNLDSNDD